jgi:hypothetical protein
VTPDRILLVVRHSQFESLLKDYRARNPNAPLSTVSAMDLIQFSAERIAEASACEPSWICKRCRAEIRTRETPFHVCPSETAEPAIETAHAA